MAFGLPARIALGAALVLTTATASATAAGSGSAHVAAARGSAHVAPAPIRVHIAATPIAQPVRYVAPVSPLRVVRSFDPPVDPYGPGHLGVDLGVAPGTVVRAAGRGTVSFAGSVAGRGVITIAHPDGVTTEYEPVTHSVSAGDEVVAGEPIGTVSGLHGTCRPDRCLHWGARRDGVYIDPLSLLRPLGPVRLLPWSSGRAPP